MMDIAVKRLKLFYSQHNVINFIYEAIDVLAKVCVWL